MNTRKISIFFKEKNCSFFLPQTGDEGVDMSSTQSGYTHKHIQTERNSANLLNENQTHTYVPNQLESPRVHSFTHNTQRQD